MQLILEGRAGTKLNSNLKMMPQKRRRTTPPPSLGRVFGQDFLRPFVVQAQRNLGTPLEVAERAMKTLNLDDLHSLIEAIRKQERVLRYQRNRGIAAKFPRQRWVRLTNGRAVRILRFNKVTCRVSASADREVVFSENVPFKALDRLVTPEDVNSAVAKLTPLIGTVIRTWGATRSDTLVALHTDQNDKCHVIAELRISYMGEFSHHPPTEWHTHVLNVEVTPPSKDAI